MATPGNESHGTHQQTSEPRDLLALLEEAGFRGQALQTAYGIALAESGGRAGAHNGNANTGDNSFGLFQINMLGAMGPARLKEYGLSSYNDLFDPLTNARVAFKMSNGGKNWQPWSTYKSGAYAQFLSKPGAQIKPAPYGVSHTNYNDSTSSTDLGLLSAPTGDPLGQLLQSYPQLRSVYNDYMAQGGASSGWDQTKLDSELNSNAWYLSLTPVQKTQVMDSISSGETAAFNAAQAGKSLSASDQLKQFAAQMGVKFSDGWFLQQAANIAGGTGTVDQSEETIKKMAMSAFPTLADQIKAGSTVADIASPYVNTMAQTLEIAPGKVDLFDPMIRKALTSVDPETNKPALMPLWSFENTVKRDPRWQGTQNAQDSLMGAAHSVLQSWGFAS